MPIFDPTIHHRRPIRLQGYDYSKEGAYFVTVVAYRRECLFGEVMDGEMVLNECGIVVAETWRWLEYQYPYITSGISVVMPNHFHGILMIDVGGRGGSRTAPTTDSIKRKPLGQLVGAFKTVSAKQINILRNSPGLPVWQRGYYDRIIRDEREMDRIQRYIESNPSRWAKDGENLLDKNIGQPSSLPGTEKPI